MIRAAGAVLWRQTPDGNHEVAIIHRNKYEDWSLPKGKLETNETSIACASREVFEETGIRATFGQQLGTTDYEDNGQLKRVQFWAAKAPWSQEQFKPNEEVDLMRWVAPEIALLQLTHKSEREIVERFITTGYCSNVLIVLRHTVAVSRGDWDGPEPARPLSDVGVSQTLKIAQHFVPFGIQEIYTSDYFRCSTTVSLLASNLNLPVVETSSLNEETFAFDPSLATSFVNALRHSDKNILICSHNPVIPTVIRYLLGTKLKNKDLIKLEPGDAWIIHHIQGEIVGLDFLALNN